MSLFLINNYNEPYSILCFIGKATYSTASQILSYVKYLDDIDRTLPYNNRPGTDLINKTVLTDNQAINMLMKALVPEVAEDHYVATPT